MKTLIFQHIPKTAGTTFRQILETVYGFDEVVRNYDDLNAYQKFYYCKVEKPKVLCGHLFYGIHRLVPGESEYITLLRDPVERFVSQYSFIMCNTDNPHFPQFKKFEGWSLEKYITTLPYLQNAMTRYLIYRPHTVPSDEWLDRAKENLLNYKLVGLTEEFDAFIRLCNHVFGWDVQEYETANITPRKPDVDQKSLDLIEEHMQLDFQIYEFGKKLFWDYQATTGAL